MPPPPFLWQLAPEDEYIARLLGSPLHMRQTGIPLLLNNSRGIEGGLKNLWGQKVETQLHAVWNFLQGGVITVVGEYDVCLLLFKY
jgi:hypothetical protein